MKTRLFIIAAVLVAFSVFSTVVVMNHGYTGFIDLAMREQWGMQVLLDLVIALTLFLSWMIPDARARGIAALPYLLLTLTLGSIGALSYLVHRTLKQMNATSPAAA